MTPVKSVLAPPVPVMKKAGAFSKKEAHHHISGTDALANIVACVTSLLASLKDDKLTIADSPSCRKHAWDAVLQQEAEDLPNDDFTTAVKVFSDTCLADEYLRFPENQKKACCAWLNDAIAHVRNNPL